MTSGASRTWADAWDAAPCGYLVLDDGGLVLAANRVILNDLGRTREDVVGRLRLVDLLSAGGRIYHETHLMPMLRLHGEIAELALDLRHADGGRVPVLLNARRDTSGDGPVAIHVVSFDARQRRNYEREILLAKQQAEASEARALELSRTLQSTFIPPLPPRIAGLDVAVAYRPAGSGNEVGGDFYDIFQVAEREWVLTIGDVQGKGVEAATVTALARHVIRAAAVRSPSPREALLTLNDVLRGAAGTRFLTAQVVRLTQHDHGWRAVLASGGHEPPVLKRVGASALELPAVGTMLGVFATPELPEQRLELAANDLLLFTTDGVHEARDPRTAEFFGVARLLTFVDTAVGTAVDTAVGTAVGPLVESLLAEIISFSDGVTRDDVAVVGVSVAGRHAA